MSEGKEHLTREMLDAFVDGELPPADMTRMAALIEKRADLRAYVESQEKLKHHLRDSFSQVLHQAIPAQIGRLIASAAKRPVGKSRWSDWLREFFAWGVAGPAAATLAVGLVVGLFVGRFQPAPFVASVSNGQILAQGELAHALDVQLAANASSKEIVRIGLSFRSKQGDDCRTFEWMSSSVSTDGVACHIAGKWNLAALVNAPRHPNDTAAYQTAGATMPDAIRGTVSAMISGEPFDPSGEEAARAAHWTGADRK